MNSLTNEQIEATTFSTSISEHGKELLRINKCGELLFFDVNAINEQAELGNTYAMAFRAGYQAAKKEQGE
jgi:hypothetical protein